MLFLADYKHSALMFAMLTLWFFPAECESQCAANLGASENTSIRYNISTSCLLDNGWRTPVPINSGDVLTTSTAYDYRSQRYTNTHGFVHGGVDLVGNPTNYTTSTTVSAIGSGIVRDKRTTSDGLAAIWVEHTTRSGSSFIVCYGHTMALSSVIIGGSISPGAQIGNLVSYGSPIHLHLELNTSLANFSGSGNSRTYGGVKVGTVDPIHFLTTNPASGPALVLTSAPTTNPHPIVQGRTISASVSLRNDGNQNFSGDFAMSLHSSTGGFIMDIGAIKQGESVSSNGGTKSYVFSSASSITNSPGSYQIWFKMRPAGGGWSLVRGGNFSNPRNAIIEASVPLAPTASAATSQTSTGFTANWGPSSGATGYRLDVSTSSSFATVLSS
jgi:hypothetical protein